MPFYGKEQHRAPGATWEMNRPEGPYICTYSLLVAPLQAASPGASRKEGTEFWFCQQKPLSAIQFNRGSWKLFMQKFGTETTVPCAHFQSAELHWLSGCCVGLTLASSQTTTQSITHSPLPWGRKQKEGRKEGKKTRGSRHYHLMTEAKAAQMSRIERGINSLQFF